MEGMIDYPLDVLEFNLEGRKEFKKNHEEEMKYICSSLEHYYEDLIHAIEIDMSHSVASNLTYNMVLTLAKGLTSLTIYEYVQGAYMLDDDYNEVYDIWESIYDSNGKVIPLLTKLEEENYFEEDIELETFINDIIPPHCEKAKGTEKLLDFHRRVALKNGQSLSNSLICYLRHMEQWLSNIKIGIYKGIGEDYDRIYAANYSLYKREYWPNDGRNFRSHIERHKPRFELLTPDYLAKLLWKEQIDFEHTEAGSLWRDYLEEKRELYFEAKRIKFNEEQWRYFFKQVCRFEEYENWIKELRNPPESAENKQKRERLLKTNRVFTLKPAKSKYDVDILLLYVFIRDRFITEKMFVYEWYALYYILRKVGVLTNCTTEDFVKQMNDEEWFANVDKKCSANEINTYGFLTDKSPDIWDVKFKPTGNRASKNSIDNIYRKYSDLDDTIDEIYVKA